MPIPTPTSQTEPADAGRLDPHAPGRDDLLAIVGHELRNPLHALTLQLALARGSASGDTLARIEKAQRMLARYVGRATVLFELMRAPEANVGTTPVPTDLCALLRTIADGLAAEAQFRGVELALQTPPEGLQALVDPQLVEQIVDNLLLNAFKHAAARRVVLGLRIEGGTQARIEVSDDGRGVTPGDRERIFDKRAVGQNPGDAAGSGLGLWIVTRLAATLGGSVRLDDRPGGGSVFSLVFPLVTPGAAASTPVVPSSERSSSAP